MGKGWGVGVGGSCLRRNDEEGRRNEGKEGGKRGRVRRWMTGRGAGMAVCGGVGVWG